MDDFVNSWNFYAYALAIRLEALCFRVVRPSVRASSFWLKFLVKVFLGPYYFRTLKDMASIFGIQLPWDIRSFCGLRSSGALGSLGAFWGYKRPWTGFSAGMPFLFGKYLHLSILGVIQYIGVIWCIGVTRCNFRIQAFWDWRRHTQSPVVIASHLVPIAFLSKLLLAT